MCAPALRGVRLCGVWAPATPTCQSLLQSLGGAVKRLASGRPEGGPGRCAQAPEERSACALRSFSSASESGAGGASQRALGCRADRAAGQRPRSKGNLCLCPAPQWPSSHLHSPLDHQELWRNIFPAPQAVGLAMAALAAVAQAAAFKALVCSGSALVPQWPAGRRCAQHPRQPLRAGPGAERARPPPVTQPRGSSARLSDCLA